MRDGKTCVDFLTSIERHFNYLFDQYGFRLVLSEGKRSGENCLVFLESGSCKIKFHLDHGIPECYFGTRNSPPNWETKDIGLQGWYNVDPILAFMARKKPNLAVPWPKTPGAWSTDDILAALSRRLRPYIAELITLFASNLETETWQEYRADFEERVRARKNRHA